jgi:hypothetical protein
VFTVKTEQKSIKRGGGDGRKKLERVFKKYGFGNEKCI